MPLKQHAPGSVLFVCYVVSCGRGITRGLLAGYLLCRSQLGSVSFQGILGRFRFCLCRCGSLTAHLQVHV